MSVLFPYNRWGNWRVEKWFFQSHHQKVNSFTSWAILFFKSCSFTTDLWYYIVLIFLYSILVSVENIANEVLSSSRVTMWWQFPPWIRAVRKMTKEESPRASADDSKGYGGAGMENSANKTEASLNKSYTALYAWTSQKFFFSRQ